MSWDPSAIANLGAWYKADSLGLSDGTAVSSWSDSSSGAYTATQATGTKQPIFHTAQVNGLPALQFASASSQYLASSADMVFSAGPGFTVFAVVNGTQTSATAAVIGPSAANGLEW